MSLKRNSDIWQCGIELVDERGTLSEWKIINDPRGVSVIKPCFTELGINIFKKIKTEVAYLIRLKRALG